MKTDSINRSPLFYVGDKYKLIPEIKPLFPSDIRRFIEPFVGGASVTLNVNADSYLLNDIDKNVIAIHKMLCSYAGKESSFFKKAYAIVDRYQLSCSAVKDIIPDAMKQEYVKTYFARFNKEPYERLRTDYNLSNRRDFLTLYLLLIYGFNRMLRFNKKGDFNLPVGNVDFNANTVEALQTYFREMSRKDIKWSSKDFRTFIRDIQWQEGDFVYLDPPYLITFSEYNKLWNDETETALLGILDEINAAGVRFAISNVTHYKGKENTAFINWATQYNSHQVKSNYISYHDNTIKKFNEVLVTNY